MTVEGQSAWGWLEAVAAPVFDNLTGLFGPGSRFFLPYLVIAIVLAAIAYRINRRRLSRPARKGFFAYLFDPAVYFHPSSLVDLKVVIANRLFTPLMALAGGGAAAASAYFVASLLLPEEAINPDRIADIGWASLAAVTLAVTLASDFTTYWVHRLHHENAVFWPFHKLHHSAETLTPLTFARKHPVYDLIRAISNAFVVGPVQGVVFALFGVVSVPVILGVNALYALFHWTGSNLRHTHVWLSYGPILSRIFISPAQHQIHHSLAPRHHNTNYGEVFAFWDWMFGTLYVPKEYEALEFGVADAAGNREAQPHGSLKAAYLVPFKESFAALSDREKDAGALSPTPPAS